MARWGKTKVKIVYHIGDGEDIEMLLPQDSYNAWRTLPFKNNGDVMAHAVETYLNMMKELGAKPSLGLTAQCVFQGLSVEQFRQAAASGGNVLGLEDRSENLVLFLSMVAYKDPKLKKLVNAKMTTWVDTIKTFSVENGADNEYLFLNYADLSQNPLGSYGEKNLAFIEEVAVKYDPNEAFQRTVPGGFKLSNARTTACLKVDGR
ncbi:hypothetical protein OOU_Y34scaffold00982g3 [Pyricularia oryzae Y34]|uniref:Berberine/berberine-like domain-containing protein n=1 Tax=Pyricularia oryzae (strain Y34) TaxID=1143189 RepID=A0AA97NN65_PYRO3|nr:hypothetical protein OOU_Y34scaffold00982g3 [Pyricularia oryzae Y34]